MVDLDERTPATGTLVGAPAEPTDAPSGLRRFRWTYCLWVCVAAFLLWLLLDAPTLQHNAQVSPIGTRREVALDILNPLAAVSRGLQLSHVVSVGDGILGHDGDKVGQENGTLITKGPSGPSHPVVAKKTSTTKPGGGPTTTVPAWQHPTAAAPLRVLVIGDSLGIDLGDTLVNDLSNTGVVQATLDGVESTGLSRPDYYNWPAELQSDLPKYNPQLVVIMLGANDPQDIPTSTGSVVYGTPQWDQVYSQRVASFMSEASSQGAKVIWVGMPPMQDPGLNADMEHLDSLYQAEAAKNPNVTYVSSWTVLGTPQGQYTPFVESAGQEVNVREPDGTHIAPGGGQVLSETVMDTMRSQLHIALPG